MANHVSVVRYGLFGWSNLSSIPVSVCWNQRCGFAGDVSGAGLSRYVALRFWAESTVAALPGSRTRPLRLASRVDFVSMIFVR